MVVADYIAKLHQLSEHFDFGSTLDNMLQEVWSVASVKKTITVEHTHRETEKEWYPGCYHERAHGEPKACLKVCMIGSIGQHLIRTGSRTNAG